MISMRHSTTSRIIVDARPHGYAYLSLGPSSYEFQYLATGYLATGVLLGGVLSPSSSVSCVIEPAGGEDADLRLTAPGQTTVLKVQVEGSLIDVGVPHLVGWLSRPGIPAGSCL
jgi:hypothetical protein